MSMSKSFSSTNDVIKRVVLLTNITLLIIHFLYLIFFLITDVKLMLYINIVSVLFFALMFIPIKFGEYAFYTLVSGAKIVIFITCETMLCGFNGGYYLTLIGLSVVAFVASYFSKKRSGIIHPIPWAVALFIDCVFLYFWCRFNAPRIDLSVAVSDTLFVLHITFVFACIIIFSKFLVRYSVSLEKSIIKESKTDRLTSLANRTALYEYFINIEPEKEKYVLGIFDIDDFKAINDSYGHLCGDYVLKEVSRLASVYLENDFVSRYGGEEFVFISKLTNYNEVIAKVEGFREEIARYSFIYNDVTMHITLTVGMSVCEENYTLNDWISKSDERLYLGKQEGKDRIIY